MVKLLNYYLFLQQSAIKQFNNTTFSYKTDNYHFKLNMHFLKLHFKYNLTNLKEMLTTEQKNLVKATVPILREHGVTLTSHFYKRMFTHNPELKNIFNMGNQHEGKQQTALAMAVLAYAENIENPSVLLPAVNKIGHKHTSLDIRAEHYPIVGKHLIASISEVLGEGATPEILDAWTKAYEQLANLFIGHEAKLYNEQTNKPGGWSGWRPFIVKKKVKESEEITSFYLYPSDGGPAADFKPGQYISVNLFIPQLNLLQPRQYSLSNTPNGEYYRISVKREPENNTPAGMVSNQLHSAIAEGDMVEIAAPAGDFYLDMNKNNTVVFISGGIGQTPLLSMLETLIKTGSKREIVWVHGCRNCSVHAFGDLVDKYSLENNKLRKFFFYEHKEGNQDCYEGIVDVKNLCGNILLPGADYYICGPSAFIKKQYNDLRELGVRSDSIFYEEFGPHVLTLN